MRLLEYLDDLMVFAGTTLIGVGVWLIYPPASLIVVGVVLLAIGLYAARR